MTRRVEPLAHHQLEHFSCGHADLDAWLVHHSRAARGQGTRTYVLVDDDVGVVGYFALAPHLLEREQAPRALARGAPHQIPAVLLAKLALDESVQGRGVGSDLLVVALEVVVEAARKVGGRVVVVDAIGDEARSFYERHDFRPLPGRPDRLVMKLSTAARALGVAWP